MTHSTSSDTTSGEETDESFDLHAEQSFHGLLSQDAKGKRRAIGQDQLQNDANNAASGSRVEPIKRPKLTKESQARARAQLGKTPAGPFLDAFAIQSGSQYQAQKGRGHTYVPARATRLPFWDTFVNEVSSDAQELLENFMKEWKFPSTDLHRSVSGDAGRPSTSTRGRSILECFSCLWKAKGWHLIELSWGEDLRTRQRFFHAVTRCFLDVVARLRTSVDRDDHLLIRIGGLMAIYLLWACQSVPPRPVLGLPASAYGCPELLADENDNALLHSPGPSGLLKLKITTSELEGLLELPNQAQENFTESERRQSTAGQPGSVGALDIVNDISFVLRHLLGYSPSFGSTNTSQISPSAFQILPSEEIVGKSRDPPQLPVWEVITEETKQRRTNAYGSSRREMTSEQDGMSRADHLLMRAYKALGIRRTAPHAIVGTDEVSDDGDVDQQEDDHRPDDSSKQTMTLFKGVWLEKPFRPLKLSRVEQLQQHLVRKEGRRLAYEEEAGRGRLGLLNLSSSSEHPQREAESLLSVDVPALADSSGLTQVVATISSTTNPLDIPDDAQAIFQLARQMTRERIKEGLRAKEALHGESG